MAFPWWMRTPQSRCPEKIGALPGMGHQIPWQTDEDQLIAWPFRCKVGFKGSLQHPTFWQLPTAGSQSPRLLKFVSVLGVTAFWMSVTTDQSPSHQMWETWGNSIEFLCLTAVRLRSNTPSLMTLLELQGLVMPEDGDIMRVQLKPHQCWRQQKIHGLGLQSGTMRSRKIVWTGGGVQLGKKETRPLFLSGRALDGLESQVQCDMQHQDSLTVCINLHFEFSQIC